VLELQTAAQVLAVDSSKVRWPAFNAIGLIGKHSDTELDIGVKDQGNDHTNCDYEVRMLAPSSGMSEDPITGSLNAALAKWLHAKGRLKQSLSIAQGTLINRHGRVYITPDPSTPNAVRIGGHTHLLVEGTINIDGVGPR